MLQRDQGGGKIRCAGQGSLVRFPAGGASAGRSHSPGEPSGCLFWAESFFDQSSPVRALQMVSAGSRGSCRREGLILFLVIGSSFGVIHKSGFLVPVGESYPQNQPISGVYFGAPAECRIKDRCLNRHLVRFTSIGRADGIRVCEDFWIGA